jgi:FdhE protein
MASAVCVRLFLVSSDKARLSGRRSLYWAQMASLIPGKARAEYGEARQFCPVCGSMPVSSMVQLAPLGAALRSCGETDVGVSAATAEQTRDLNYWSLENESGGEAESCGDCGTYLKILYQEKDPKVKRWPTISPR